MARLIQRISPYFQIKVQSCRCCTISGCAKGSVFVAISIIPRNNNCSWKERRQQWRLTVAPGRDAPPTHSEKSLGWCGKERRRRDRGVKQCEDEGLSVCFKELRLSVLERFWLIWQNKGSREISPLLTQRLSLADSGRAVEHGGQCKSCAWCNYILYQNRIWGQMFCCSPCDCFCFFLKKNFSPYCVIAGGMTLTPTGEMARCQNPFPHCKWIPVSSLRSPAEVWALNEALSTWASSLLTERWGRAVKIKTKKQAHCLIEHSPVGRREARPNTLMCLRL